ncbi:MAG: hypothetical protein E4H13_06885 [Calditrichales bacterium]|nr:MAG: hypothetical protein E4H13_06885 [Calditrichales bacterium]
MKPDHLIEEFYRQLADVSQSKLDTAIASVIDAKRNGGKVVVVTGSGPNMHEGVTTLIAEMIHKGLIDGVTTSAAVIAHEMAGSLDRVKRVNGKELGFEKDILPRGDVFEVTMMAPGLLEELRKEMLLDEDLIQRVLAAKGETIIKAAGNMAYPMGLRTELLAKEIMIIARSRGIPFETVAGAAADEHTMLGAAFKKGIPLLVTIPQLVGGGMVGLAIGDSISLTERASKIASMLAGAQVIIESAVALTQEIHDGPFETYTGHGIWSRWEGLPTYSLEGKTLIRIDTDPNLLKAWQFEKESKQVQEAIDKGLPKTKLMDIPFRMEMSGFARLEKSIPVVGDIGKVWPVMAHRISKALDIPLDFISWPQDIEQGRQMREWIVEQVRPLDRKKLQRTNF